MKSVVLPVGRPYDWRVFWILSGANVLAVTAIIPFALNLQRAYMKPEADFSSTVEALILDRVFTIFLAALLGGTGLHFANRVGLGLPLLGRWLERRPLPWRVRSVVAMSVLTGVCCGGGILLADFQFFRPGMLTMIEELGITTPKEAVAPPLYGLLAAFSAGVTEETLFRLFGVSLIVLVAMRIIRPSSERPTSAVLWSANILIALAFGAVHFANVAVVGWPLNTLVVARTLVLNGAAGLLFGWLFWTYGLESAMVAHVSTDVVLYVLLPLVLFAEEGSEKVLTGVGVIAVVVLVMIWAGRTLFRERSYSGDTAASQIKGGQESADDGGGP